MTTPLPEASYAPFTTAAVTAPPTGDDQMRTALSARGLTKTFGRGSAQVHALRGVDIDISARAFTAIMGPSGSGKSTLMHCLAGLDQPTSGSVRLGATDLTGLDDTRLTVLRRERVGFVFQSFNLLPTLSAKDNILLPLQLAGRRPDQQWVDDVVGILGIADRLGHRPAELSGGEQQRVAVARALVTRPEVVFADEPTGALDTQTGAELLAFLRRCVRELGQTVVMVTHDPVAATYADRVVVLVDGAIAREVLEPTTDTVLAALRTMGA